MLITEILCMFLERAFGNAWELMQKEEKGIDNLKTDLIAKGKAGLGRKDETQEVCSPCGTCKKSNNLEKDCYFKNMEENKGDQEEKKKVCFLTENNGTKQWILDSRTTSYMVNKLEYLKE
ncbi:hypothetical protein WN48_00015 [Eufriesea mexicana]|uniref:Copia protein n=1 Tax=Eufriesea mexicana TaxID=516756 RepID=A0A310SLR2_9HYME|nr:hypothetical protein WN48_00015 [Eufriesea mexicana]